MAPKYFTSLTGETYEVPAHNVFTRARWDKPWVLRDDLFCDELSFGVSPDRNSAVISRIYGRQVPRGKSAVETIKPIDISGHWVKIEIEADDEDKMLDQFGFITWIGQEGQVADDQGGVQLRPKLNTDTRLPGLPDPEDEPEKILIATGRQVWTCFGFDNILDRIRITHSVIQGDTEPFYIQRGLIFNDPALDGDPLTAGPGNRSQLKGPRDVFIFADPKKDLTSHWSTRDIVEYLLEYHRTVDRLDIKTIEKTGKPFAFGNVPMKWAAKQLKNIVPNWDRPVRNFHGMTVTKAFDKLLERKRGLGWRINTFEVEGLSPLPSDPTETQIADFQAQRDDQITVVLRPFSFLASTLRIDSERALAPNGDQETLNLQDKKSIQPLIVSKSSSRQYQRVKAVGRRIRSTFSLSNTDKNLVLGWGSTDAIEYSISTSLSANYPTRRDQKQTIDAEHRKSDRFADLWTLFKLPDDWDGLIGENDPRDPDSAQDPLDSAIINSKGKIGKFYRGGLRFLSHIPVAVNATGLFERVAEGKRSAFALINVGGTAFTFRGGPTAFDNLPDSQRPPYFVQIENLKAASGLEKDKRGSSEFDWSGSLSIDKRDAAVRIKVRGAPKHVMGDDTFDALPHDDKGVELTWEKLVITVQAELDEFVEAIFPEAATLDGDLDIIRTLRVEMGDEYGLDFVSRLTVTGVDEGQLVRAPQGFIRDDREKLKEIAQLAHVWYSRERISVEWSVRELFNPVIIGGYILTSGPLGDDFVEATVIDSVVTKIRINLQQRPPIVTTTTSYAELDFGHITRQLRR